jgi:hypothetical protein
MKPTAGSGSGTDTMAKSACVSRVFADDFVEETPGPVMTNS